MHDQADSILSKDQLVVQTAQLVQNVRRHHKLLKNVALATIKQVQVQLHVLNAQLGDSVLDQLIPVQRELQVATPQLDGLNANLAPLDILAAAVFLDLNALTDIILLKELMHVFSVLHQNIAQIKTMLTNA